MALIRPRLTDHYGVMVPQSEVDFAIPFLDEDLPFCVDPFLLWKSPSLQDNALHGSLLNSFNYLGYLSSKGKYDLAVASLIRASECDEVGLGFSATRKGKRIGEGPAGDILSLFSKIPDLKKSGFTHFEAIQLYVDNISKDRISDITCSFLKSFLIDYTIDQCMKHGIPLFDVGIKNVYDVKNNMFVDEERVKLPLNPDSKAPILLVPKRWLRKSPWINADSYIKDYYLEHVLKEDGGCPERGEILSFNRCNYGVVEAYIKVKELAQKDCVNDPLFTAIPILSAKKKFQLIKALPTGKDQNADKKYEDYVCQLMASLLYPQLDFAQEQSRTDTGVIIRDLVFYNNKTTDFLGDVFSDYGSKQIVMELKNVASVNRDHINQLNRYLNDEFGKFGVLVTRKPLPRPMFKNTVDLWSGQRRCIITLTDEDVEVMVQLFESKQRSPIDVLKKKYVEFKRACPG